MRKLNSLTVIITLFIISGCSSHSVNRFKVIEKYTRNLRYESDSIFFRENNVFTRKIKFMGFPMKYYGFYTNSNDTIYLQYHNSKQPKNELSIALRKDNSIVILEIYDKIKDKYSYFSKDELSKIDKKELMTKDTASIEYKNIK
jgi:hypothetical protein